MNTADPVILGLATFLLWTALGGLCFLIAVGTARFVASPPRQLYAARLVVMAFLVVVWWLVVPLASRAYIGNHADPEDANRRARYAAKESGKQYGAQTIWAWCLVALFTRPRIHEAPAR